LHFEGFLHGDVKPENIRLVEEGRAVLLDLGFAHRLGENATLFDEGYILGTVDYLAPELCGPQPTEEQRSDIFSLGVTLFEMLAGTLPYAKRSVTEALRERPGEETADLRAYRPDLPESLAQLVDRLLAPHPQLRPRSLGVVQQLINLEIVALRRRRAA